MRIVLPRGLDGGLDSGVDRVLLLRVTEDGVLFPFFTESLLSS